MRTDPLHSDEELSAIVLAAMAGDEACSNPEEVGRAVEASTVAKLAAASGDWEERWFRVLGGDCGHYHPGDIDVVEIDNPVCGDCALALAREAVAEVRMGLISLIDRELVKYPNNPSARAAFYTIRARLSEAEEDH